VLQCGARQTRPPHHARTCWLGPEARVPPPEPRCLLAVVIPLCCAAAPTCCQRKLRVAWRGRARRSLRTSGRRTPRTGGRTALLGQRGVAPAAQANRSSRTASKRRPGRSCRTLCTRCTPSGRCHAAWRSCTGCARPRCAPGRQASSLWGTSSSRMSVSMRAGAKACDVFRCHRA